MIPSASLHLLSQDNSIPGNRKDGFRFHHLLFVVIATPIYLWLELSFGVRLLDNIGGQVVSQDTAAIEHWGRLISGLAVSLLFLSGWVRQCEKYNTPWVARLLVSLLITLACMVFTWWAQGKVIEFYVKRSNAEINTALRLLGVVVIVGFLAMRAWIRYAISHNQSPYWRLALGLLTFFIVGHVLINHMVDSLSSNRENIGLERQQAATLTLVRRGLEEHIYALDGVNRDARTLSSAEGKAFLALFPIFGATLDQNRFAQDRPYLLRELMYRDWNTQFGEQSFAAFTEAVAQLQQIYDTVYRASNLPAAQWSKKLQEALPGQTMRRGLSWPQFAEQPASRRFLRNSLGCLDCEFSYDMDREHFGRELHKWTQAHNVQRAIDTFGSAQHFETGRDGERAARAYWVPIWALLFSIVGAFTHIFKMIFTITEYAHRQTFHRIRAADSKLANEVIANSRIVTAAVVISMMMVIYFADNRITGHERYIEYRPLMWRTHPITGAIAAHWTVNAQGFFYPFTSKIRPSWLEFNTDPISHVPLLADWIQEDL